MTQKMSAGQIESMKTMVGLFGAIMAGPSNAGTRRDGAVCTAKPGECRHNYKYYTPGMRDTKSWSDPCADEECPMTCPFLSKTPHPREPEEERRRTAINMLRAGLA